MNVNDSPQRVFTNRKLAAVAAGKPIRFADQVHSNDVLTLGDMPAALETSCGTADGLVTRLQTFALGVLVADCVPILFADPVARVVGTAHAGRAGLLRGVIGEVVGALQDLGASPQHLRVAVGPCICARCYEVPQSMATDFAVSTGVPPAETAWGTPSLDLRQAASEQLAGLGIAAVTHIFECTKESGSY